MAARGAVHAIKYVFNIPDVQFHERLVNEKLEITFDLLLDTLFFAPIIETLLFQSLFFLVYKKFKLNKWFVVTASGLLFGATHDYSIFYMINATLVGFIFMYFYILRAEAEKEPLKSTIIAHAIFNLIVTIVILLTRLHANFVC